MKYKRIIFDTIISGHHLEYLHHIYEGICDDCVIVVPNKFNLDKNKFDWPFKDNVVFDLIPDKVVDSINHKGHLSKSLLLSILLRKYIIKYEAEKVFLISSVDFYPFLPVFLPSKTLVSGIIYKIYLYEWEKYSIFQKIYEGIRIYSMTCSSKTGNIFVLNDKSATLYLNKLWKTDKFAYLVDPYVPCDESKLIDIRRELAIPNNALLFLHLGFMESRKGTLDILDAIMTLQNIDNKYFIFAGKVSDDIKIKFYESINKLANKKNIIVYDKFCEYSFFASLCKSCDCILIPYKRVSLSSGIINYASQFHKTVIGPSSGLIGKLIKRYRLGYTLDVCNGQNVRLTIEKYKPIRDAKWDKLLHDSTVEKFCKIILSKI